MGRCDKATEGSNIWAFTRQEVIKYIFLKVFKTLTEIKDTLETKYYKLLKTQ